MKIVVQNVNGDITILEVEFSDSIECVKAKIQGKEGTPVEQQRLFFDRQQLKNEHTLKNYNVQSGATLVLIDK